jgi:hypothetical protein
LDYLIALSLAAAAGWLFSAVGPRALRRSVSAFAVLIGGWRDDGWPRGVQEEDRDHGWLARPVTVETRPAPALEDAATLAPTSPIRARTGLR